MTKEEKAAHALVIESKLKRLPVFKSHTIMNLIENQRTRSQIKKKSKAFSTVATKEGF
jgi:hypothetical protein